MFDLPYSFKALFAVARIAVWFWLLFVVIAPWFLRHIRDLPEIEKMIYSWIGLGGAIIATVFILTILHIYDFISLVLTLLLIPLIVNFLRQGHVGISEYVKQFELSTVVSHVKFIENYDGFSWSKITNRVKMWFKSREWPDSYTLIAIFVAMAGGFTRMYAALQNAAPFSRVWYMQLDRIKNLRLQDYFTDIPDPGGMHALVSLFSMFTQVSPEMILHLLGALISFFLCIVIFWATKDITKNEYPLAPIFAMSIYALAPMLFLPLSLDQQVEANTLDLALCFAIPTITILARNLRGRYKGPWFYVGMGLLATTMTNFFVGFVILLPAMILAIILTPRKNYGTSVARHLLYLLGSTVVLMAPFVIYLLYYDMDMLAFFRQMIYDTQAYSYFPGLILELPQLSQYYVAAAGILLAGTAIRAVVTEGRKRIDEMIILIFIIGVSAIHLPQFPLNSVWMDPDQLSGFYALLICIFFGIAFANLMRILSWVVRYHAAVIRGIERMALVGGVAALIYWQGGVELSRVLPSTVPNGFYEAYYNIIDEHLPYSYATVGPEIDQSLAKNRHYFMNYNFFLNQYGSIDSLYHQWLSVPRAQRSNQSIPPASIFVFVEKPPYGSIQQGILYNAGTVMRDIEQWFDQFKKLEDRTVNTFYSTDEVTVYEIVNRRGESEIDEVLLHVNPENREEDE